MARRPLVLAWVLPHLLGHVGAHGGDPAAIRSLPGIRGRDLDDPDLRVPDEAVRSAWETAERICGDEALGLHLAEALPRGALDLLEFAFRSSANLGRALQQVERYSRLLNDRAEAHLDLDGDRLVLTFGREGAQPIHPQRADFGLALVVRLARECLDAPLSPVEVRFAHPAPESLFEHRRLFRSRLRFGQPRNALVYPAAAAAQPFRTADGALAVVSSRRLEKVLEAAPPADAAAATSERVRRLLLAELARGEPSAGGIARELGMSVRTMSRRLGAEGTTFRRVLDALRGEMATALLCEPGIAIGEIAFFLGYSEPAAFHRSFKRWTGQTPDTFRRASRTA